MLNNRLVSYLEINAIYAEEQNVFRQKRSCSQNIFSLCTILRNRKSQKKSTYLAFLDSEKAFDRVDRDLLLYKLLRIGINNIYESIKNIYQNSYCSVNLNKMLTDWFNTKAGIKQGDSLLPTMFGIFINNIVEDVKSVNTGIEIDGHNICILHYADDIVLLSDTEEGLQNLLDKVYQWSLKWKIKFYAKKSNILHVRQSLITRTNFNFKLENMVLPIVTQYKYLGIVITEFIDYNVIAQILADAANRAMGSVKNKYMYV